MSNQYANFWSQIAVDFARLPRRILKAVISGSMFMKWIYFIPSTLSLRDYIIICRHMLHSVDIVEGPYIKLYEKAFAEYLGLDYAISFASGRLSLYAILKGMGIGKGDEVLVQAFTCVVVPNAIINAGAKPVYVDIDPSTYNMDINQIEGRISSRTKAIIAQHTFGLPTNMDAIKTIAKKRGLRVIEDCAIALGAKYKGNKVGTLGDAAIFSSERSKMISTEMGGLAVTNNPDLAGELRNIQSQCQKPLLDEVRSILTESLLLEMSKQPAGYSWLKFFSRCYQHLIKVRPTEEEMKGIKSHDYERQFTNVQARIGINQLRSLDYNIEHRKWVTERYEELLPNLGLSLVNIAADVNPVFVRYPIYIENAIEAIQYAIRFGVEFGNWFEGVIYPPGVSLKALGYTPGLCPAAESAARHIINLPTHQRIGKKEVTRIRNVLQTFLSRHKAT